MSFISTKLMSTIHIHNFVNKVIADQNQPDDENYIKIHINVNIFQEDFFYDSRIIVEPIHCSIHAYLTQFHRELCSTNAFFYADGRFATTVIEDKLQITVQAFSLQRYGTFRFSFTQTSFLMSLLQTFWWHRWFWWVLMLFIWEMMLYDHDHWFCWSWQWWDHRTISMLLFWTSHFCLWFTEDWSHQLHT